MARPPDPGPDQPLDDAALVRAFQSGDEAAFTALVQRHRQAVYRVARGILRSHEEADEAAQEAFVKAWQALGAFRGEASFKTWVYRIAMNTAFDMRTREAGRRRVRDEAEREAAVHSRPRLGPRALDALVADEELALLRAAVASLPDRQRVTLTLKVDEGLKYTEIAEVLGCPVGTAKANFHHAVQNLRRRLGGAAQAAAAAAGDDHDA